MPDRTVLDGFMPVDGPGLRPDPLKRRAPPRAAPPAPSRSWPPKTTHSGSTRRRGTARRPRCCLPRSRTTSDSGNDASTYAGRHRTLVSGEGRQAERHAIHEHGPGLELARQQRRQGGAMARLPAVRAGHGRPQRRAGRPHPRGARAGGVDRGRGRDPNYPDADDLRPNVAVDGFTGNPALQDHPVRREDLARGRCLVRSRSTTRRTSTSRVGRSPTRCSTAWRRSARRTGARWSSYACRIATRPDGKCPSASGASYRRSAPWNTPISVSRSAASGWTPSRSGRTACRLRR